MDGERMEDVRGIGRCGCEHFWRVARMFLPFSFFLLLLLLLVFSDTPLMAQ